MVEIPSKRKYYNYISSLSLILVLVLFLMSFLVKINLYVILFLFLAIESVLLFTKFTQLIRISDKGIDIVYYKLLVKREISFKMETIQAMIDYTGSYRIPKYAVLKIFIKKKLVYSINSNDGFDEQDLIAIEKHISSKKAS